MSEASRAGAVRTTCAYCGVGCGVLATPRQDGTAHDIVGDPEHPANFGRLCSKGSALGETLGLDGRLLHPFIHGERVSWDSALDYVAQGLNTVIAKHGPQAVAFYVSGQLLTEDYYVANKLMKGYIGTANIDTNSRLCMASAVAGHKRAFGEDVVPMCYEDLALADLIVLVGSNTAWCHPIVFQRLAAAKQERPGLRIVVIDPRRTVTCELADLHLPIRAGTDVALFNGLLAHLHRNGFTDHDFVREHTHGLDAALAAAGDQATIEAVARTCRVDAQSVGEFYDLFARTERTITTFSQGVNQSSAGVDKVNSIINCHLLTARIGRPGAGPFSLTGQPNAMGGREVGGMANMLAAHMEIADPAHRDRVQRFWRSPAIAAAPGLKAVELFDAVHEGRIKALWIMATNPVVSLPDADKVKQALQRCPLVIVSDCVQRTDTTALAHVLLPAAAWGEKDGTVTNSERRISRQRAFLPMPGEARPDWWIIAHTAQRMGFADAFRFASPHEIFSEHAALSGEGNDGARAFDISGLAALTATDYDELAPIQWPVKERAGTGTARLLADGRFYHPDGRARFIATAHRPPAHLPDAEFPLVLNTGRIRDQWHTMTRSGRSPRLTQHVPEPYVDMHAQDALLAGVRDDGLVRVATRWGSIVVRLRVSGEMPRGMIFVPIHWNGEFASDARVGALVNPVVDPISGEPEFKHTPARVEPFAVSWYGFVLSSAPLAGLDVAWWTLVRGAKFLRYEIAGRRIESSWSHWARSLLGADDASADWLEYEDPSAGVYRGALLSDDRMVACAFVSARPDLPARAWLAALFDKQRIGDPDRAGLLIGRPAQPQADPGPLVCSCFGVGRNSICAAIERDGLTSAAQIGQKLRAGTNCGSCLPEIRKILAETQAR
jgi:assimilatory nitrate reductase catalytic subunit